MTEHVTINSVAATLAVCLCAAIMPAQAGAQPTNIGGSFGQPSTAPAAAYDDIARTVVVWLRAGDDHVVGRRLDANGGLSDLFDLSQDAATRIQPAASEDGSGNVLIAWVRAGDGHVVARRLKTDGSATGLIDVSQAAADGASRVGVGGGGGRAAFAWRGLDGRLYTRTLTADGSLGATTDVSGSAALAVRSGTATAVAVDAAGTATFAWISASDCSVLGREQNAAGSLGGGFDVSGLPDRAICTASPAVTAEPGGANVFTWQRDSDDGLAIRHFPATSGPGPIQRISDLADIPSTANPGASAAGSPATSLIAWQNTGAQVVYRSVSSQGAISDSPFGGRPGHAYPNSAATAAASKYGGATVAWVDNSTYSIFADVSPSTIKPPAPARQMRFAAKRLRARNGRLRIRLKCLKPKPYECLGRLILRHRGAVIGRVDYRLAAGATTVRTLRLNANGKFRLRRVRELRTKLEIQVWSQGSTLPPADEVHALRVLR